MFKVGDMVRIKTRCSGTRPGEIWTLFKDDGELWAGERNNNICGNRCCCQNYWELVPKAQPSKPKPLYKPLSKTTPITKWLAKH